MGWVERYQTACRTSVAWILLWSVTNQMILIKTCRLFLTEGGEHHLVDPVVSYFEASSRKMMPPSHLKMQFYFIILWAVSFHFISRLKQQGIFYHQLRKRQSYCSLQTEDRKAFSSRKAVFLAVHLHSILYSLLLMYHMVYRPGEILAPLESVKTLPFTAYIRVRFYQVSNNKGCNR